MWHASTMYHGRLNAPVSELIARAHRALFNVGDANLGEWIELGRAIHLRRRLSAMEAATFTLRDIRNTLEAITRLDAVRQYLPEGYTE